MASDPTSPDDAMLELVTTQHKMIMSLLDKNEVLLVVIRDCPCPRPANSVPEGQYVNVEQCVKRLECGCDLGVAFVKATGWKP